MASVQQQQHGYTPPRVTIATAQLQQHQVESPRMKGTTVRVAAMAARHARLARQKVATGSSASLSTISERSIMSVESISMRAPSPVHSRGERQPLHVKKNLKLQLNMDVVARPELPLMTTSPVLTNDPATVAAAVVAVAPRRSRVQFTEAVSVASNTTVAATTTTQSSRRRASSITLSMDSPEGAAFSEVAHDGPAQLGMRTKRVKRLGKGAGGTVYMSIYLPELKLVAVKEVIVYKEDERHMVQHELQALHTNLAPIESMIEATATHHSIGRRFFGSPKAASAPTYSTCPYQVAFYGAFLTPARCAVSIVMEFMDMGSLQDVIDAKITVSEPVLRHAAFCCVTALEHMHSRRMIHRDIKPANILLNRRGDFKVADFGLAGTLSKSASFFSEFEGTMMYMAPERISGLTYTYVSDMWSLGVVLFTLATGAYPFAVDDGFFGLEEAICTDPLPPMPNRFSVPCRDFLKRLIARDPNDRLTASQALTHDFVRGYAHSATHDAFASLWQSLPLRPAIQQVDAAAIAQVIVDHAQRHPDEYIVPESLLHATPVASTTSLASSLFAPPPAAPLKDSFFGHLTDFFGSAHDRYHHKHGDAAATVAGQATMMSRVQQLADACGVTVEYLESLLRQQQQEQAF